jgi:ADP-ribose pyrophosphatase
MSDRGRDRAFELLSSREIFKGRVLEVRLDSVRLPNDRVSELEVIRHPGAVAVAPLGADGRVLLLRQYRHATGEWVLEVPAGKLDPGEDPESAARRELEEETGYRAGVLEPMGWMWTTPGFTDEKIWLYLARDLKLATQALQDDEFLTLEPLTLSEAVERALDGSIHDAKSAVCLARAARRLGAIALRF